VSDRITTLAKLTIAKCAIEQEPDKRIKIVEDALRSMKRVRPEVDHKTVNSPEYVDAIRPN
jgi:hypothetical protein